MRYHLKVRRFLNRPGHHRGAYIVARVPDVDSCRARGCLHTWCYDAVLDIADCSRVVQLDFDMETAVQRRNAIAKANLLVDVITQFRDALVVSAEQVARRQREGGTT